MKTINKMEMIDIVSEYEEIDYNFEVVFTPGNNSYILEFVKTVESYYCKVPGEKADIKTFNVIAELYQAESDIILSISATNESDYDDSYEKIIILE